MDCEVELDPCSGSALRAFSLSHFSGLIWGSSPLLDPQDYTFGLLDAIVFVWLVVAVGSLFGGGLLL